MEHVFAGVEVAGLEKVEADADAAAGEAAENVDLDNKMISPSLTKKSFLAPKIAFLRR